MNKTKNDVDVLFARRHLNLNAIPATGTPITVMDLDLTVSCNLRCVYCFKEKWNEHMEEQVAFDAIIWLMYASGSATELTVNLMGGEPLMRFPLIKRIVPFAKRRAWQIGKSINFGMTTNGTLVSDSVVGFFKKWGLGFHTSIDGAPDIQDRNRPMASGGGSSRLIEKSVTKILAYRPATTARTTIIPDGAGAIVKNYHYFRSLGYTNMVFVPGSSPHWTPETLKLLEEQLRQLGDLLIEEYRDGNNICESGIDGTIIGLIEKKRPIHMCGAGRGMVLVDIHGVLWPCHRWNKASEKQWRIGSIYEEFNELARAGLDRANQTDFMELDCANCSANICCNGGCPAENLEETGSVYKRHPNSCHHKIIWYQVGKYIHDVLYNERNPVFMKKYYPAEWAPGIKKA